MLLYGATNHDLNLNMLLSSIFQTGTTLTDQMDLLCEQVKMLAGEVALSTSLLKRLSEQAARNPEDSQIKVYFAILILGHNNS